MAEQALDEFIKMIEEMISQQIDISNDLINHKVDFENLSTRENNQINNYKDLKKACKCKSDHALQALTVPYRSTTKKMVSFHTI